MANIRRVYTYIDDDTFYNLIKRARLEGVYADQKGIVDIGALLKKLVETYSSGQYTIIQDKKTSPTEETPNP